MSNSDQHPDRPSRSSTNIYRFTFPIPDYNNQGIFKKQIYFRSEHCPTHSDVIRTLQTAHGKEVLFADEHPEWGPHTFEYQACLIAIDQIERDHLPYLSSSLMLANVFCNTKFGKQPLSVCRIRTLDIPESK